MSQPARSLPALPAPASKRWAALLLASAFFHWIAIEWVNGNLAFPAPASPTQPLITAQLQARHVDKAAPKTAEPRPPQRKNITSAAKQPTSSLQQSPSVAPVIETVARHESVDVAEDSPSAAAPGSETESVPSSSEFANGGEDRSSDYQANLPPPVELKYEVQAQKKGLSYYGTGTIHWQTDGSRYAITGKAKAAFFTVLEFKSEGEVDKSGISPVLYAERAGNRAETNTHFHRERNTISFSASSLSYPRVGGEQDRASIIWQLAAMGRAYPKLFKPSEELSIFVAGVRNAAPWRIYIIGEEEVQLDAGSVKSWHVKSVPQQGGYEKTFDIWFASGYEWYPVKLRQTEVSGDYLELTLSNLILAQQ